jgi:hypothetical protein
MSNLERRLFALEGGRGRAVHEQWVEAMERAERGETVDWSKLPATDQRELEKLR